MNLLASVLLVTIALELHTSIPLLLLIIYVTEATTVLRALPNPLDVHLESTPTILADQTVTSALQVTIVLVTLNQIPSLVTHITIAQREPGIHHSVQMGHTHSKMKHYWQRKKSVDHAQQGNSAGLFCRL